MQSRRFGRTNHVSTLAIFGGVALGKLDQEDADCTMQLVLDSGISHIDIAPSYGAAEERLGPWMGDYRSQFFLGCKTTERTYTGAKAELRQSLVRLQTESFDLYQLHAVKSFEELDSATRKGGALEALVEARSAGLTHYLGITSHGIDAPLILIEALRRFDFDSVLFPINFVLFGNSSYRKNCEDLLNVCQARDVGSMIIKSICKQPWGNRERIYHTWYEPFDELAMVQLAVNFVLSQPVTGLCTAGDYRLLPLLVRACEQFHPMTLHEQETLITMGKKFEPLFN